jgi:hypothetical protein
MTVIRFDPLQGKVELADPAKHARCIEAGAATRRYRETCRLSWLDWTIVIGPALLICRDTARERMGRIGLRYEQHMGQLLKFYDVGINAQDRSALYSIMERLDEINRWRELQFDKDDLNNPHVVWRNFQKSSRGFDRQRESLDTILCRWVLTLAKALILVMAKNNRLRQELEWERADPARRGASRPVQTEVYQLAPEVADILEKIGDTTDPKTLRRFLRKESESDV